MNPLNKSILREEIQWLLEAITEQFEAINSYEGKIPQIEFDIIMENIRKLYENLHQLNRMGDASQHVHLPKTEIPEIKPRMPETVTRESGTATEERHPGQSTVKIRIEEGPEPVQKEHRHKSDPPEIDLFSSEMAGFSEKLKETREKTFANDRRSSHPKDLKASISINEKFLFINELFDGNLREYNITIETLNGFAEIRQALEFLDVLRLKNLWESESVAFNRLRELVEQKF